MTTISRPITPGDARRIAAIDMADKALHDKGTDLVLSDLSARTLREHWLVDALRRVMALDIREDARGTAARTLQHARDVIASVSIPSDDPRARKLASSLRETFAPVVESLRQRVSTPEGAKAVIDAIPVGESAYLPATTAVMLYASTKQADREISVAKLDDGRLFKITRTVAYQPTNNDAPRAATAAATGEGVDREHMRDWTLDQFKANHVCRFCFHLDPSGTAECGPCRKRHADLSVELAREDEADRWQNEQEGECDE